MNTNFSAKSQKFLAASSVFLAPAAADAAVVHVTGAPVSMSLANPVGAVTPWDVDGTGNAEFELRRKLIVSAFSDRTFFTERVDIASDGPLNGRGFVVQGSNIVTRVDQSNMIGQTLNFGATGISDRNIVSVSTNNLHPYGPYIRVPAFDFYGVSTGLNYIGFAFDPGDGLHYGWAKLELTSDVYNSAVTIHEWAYESETGEEVHVGNIPVPAMAPGLALLALGAAGVRHWRQRKGGEDRA